MARHFAVPQLFRQMPNALLKRYFARHQLFGGLDFEKMKQRNVEALIDAWEKLPGDHRRALEPQLREIFDLSSQKGTLAIIDEARWQVTRQESSNADLVAKLSVMTSHFERAMTVFLDHPHLWKGATRFFRADSLSRWKKRSGFPKKDACLDRKIRPIFAADIEVPFDRLKRWQASGEAVAAFVASSLRAGRLHGMPIVANEWPVGRFRAGRAENIVLENRGELVVCVAGHVIPLIEIAVLESDGLKVERERLVDAVAHPAVGGGRREPRPERAARLAHRFDELKAAGFPAPRQILAADENVKVETSKKLLTEGRERIRRQGPKKS